MPKRTGIFVTGTDTGVGKTEVGRAAVGLLRGEGLSVSVMKPIETGVGPEGPLDALALREAAGVPDAIDLVCPHQFSLPAAPNVAAEEEGRNVDLPLIMSTYETLRAHRDFIWVEGAGGILVPVTDDFSMADLAKALALPVLLVARASLGTINHTLLSLAEIDRQNLECVGVVLSHSAQQTSEADLKNLGTLRKTLGPRLIGELPTLRATTRRPTAGFARSHSSAERVIVKPPTDDALDDANYDAMARSASISASSSKTLSRSRKSRLPVARRVELGPGATQYRNPNYSNIIRYLGDIWFSNRPVPRAGTRRIHSFSARPTSVTPRFILTRVIFMRYTRPFDAGPHRGPLRPELSGTALKPGRVLSDA